MRKLNKLLLGLSACVGTLVPTTIALTSCSNTYISYLGSKSRSVSKTTSATNPVSIRFTLSNASNRPKVATFQYVDVEEENSWLRLATTQYENNYLLFYFNVKDDWEGEYPTVKGAFHFEFEIEGQTETKKYDFSGFTFNAVD